MQRFGLSLASLLLFGLITTLASAQDIVPLSIDNSGTLRKASVARQLPLDAASLIRFRHYTALQRSQATFSSRGVPPDVGDIQTFNVDPILRQGWVSLEFTLVAKGTGYHLWVHNDRLSSGDVTQAHVDAFVEVLTTATPDPSVNPNAGILSNNKMLFGDIFDIDQDGQVDILWHSIRDDLVTGSILGYLSPEDYNPSAAPGEGNGADVIYLDTDPVGILTEGIPVVAEAFASLHQQLIHINYDLDETPFITSGLFEWAKIANGYSGRGARYLADRIEHGVPLFSFEFFGSDFERASLFMNYLAEQFGSPFITALSQSGTNDFQAIEALLRNDPSGRTLGDIILDFHTANFLNDTSLDTRLGYASSAYQNIGVSSTRLIDGSFTASTPETRVELRSGAFQYLTWENVSDFRFGFDAVAQTQRNAVRAQAILIDLNGSASVVPLVTGASPALMTGNFATVTVVLASTVPDVDALNVAATYNASWAGTAIPVANQSYDSGSISSTNGQEGFFGIAPDWVQAVRFSKPEGQVLNRLGFAPFFQNQFTQNGNLIGSPGEARDLRVIFYEEANNGQPGDILFEMTVDDPRLFFFVENLNLDFFSFDVRSDPAFQTLPETFFVGIGNTGNDSNELVMGVSPYTGPEVSYLFATIAGTTGWFPLQGLQAGGQSFSNRVIPIRAQFIEPSLTNVSNERPPSLPTDATLHPNYPNPFNPTTTIRFDLSEATPVRLAVYDLLGRERLVLINTFVSSGSHTVELDASDWESGTYFYMLQTPRQHLKRSLVLVK